MRNFESEYKQLNPQQKKAVDKIDGPLLVVAGPGTGKTQLLSARAANILRKSDANARNILCLTFTEKAASNMKDRMLELIGPEARNIVVKTFHGLGAELINSYPEYFWNAAQLQAAPEIVKREIVEDILIKRPLHDPLTLKFAGQYTQVARIIKDIDQAKKAGLDPGRLHAIANANVAYLESIPAQVMKTLGERISKKSLDVYRQLLDDLDDQDLGDSILPLRPISEVLKNSLEEAIDEAEASGKTKPLSEWKSKWTTSEQGERVFVDLKRSRNMIALSEVYEQYQEIMHQRGYFDYSDMILEAITQLIQREDLLTQVQERFSYIMIDEFQDTNDAQFRMVNLIANNPVHEGRPNIMAVGDDDQAIYRFQGADLSNIDSFTRAFEGVEEIVLRDNYRSHQSVLDSASEVADLIERRLVNEREGLDKRIEAKNKDIRAGEIVHIQYPSWAHQMSAVADRAREAFKKGDESVAVIARGHKSLEQLAGILHRQNVPIRYERRSNILEHPLVELLADLAELTEAIAEGDSETADKLTADLMVHPVFGADPVEAYSFAVSMRRKSDWLKELTSHSSAVLSNFAGAVFALAQLSREMPAAMVIEYLLGLRELEGYRFPLRDYYIGGEQDSQYMQGLSALQRLRSLVMDFSQVNQPKLADFARFLRLNQRHGIVIADESTFVSSDKAIELMTAHSAKGLEFDKLFIIDMVDKEWSPSNRGGKPPANLESMQPYGESSDDYARLAFVAMTRARSDIIATSYSHDDQGKYTRMSPYIQHLDTVEDDTQHKPVDVIEQVTRWPLLNTSDIKQLLTPLLEGYELPVTHLLNFLDIAEGGPEYFIERNLLRLPEEKAPHLAYGSAIHAGVEAAHRLTNAGKMDKQAVIEAFTDRLSKEQIEPNEEERRREQGERLLSELIDQQRLVFEEGDQPERVISGLRIGEARIGGKLDVVRSKEDSVRIIDYKTGAPPSSLTTESKTDGLKAYKHRLQLVFYGLLAQEAGIATKGKKVIGEMIYLESENPKRFAMEYEVSAEEIDRVRMLVEAVWARVQDLDFPSVDAYSSDLSGIIDFEEYLLSEHKNRSS